MLSIIATLFSGGKDSTLALHKAYALGIKTDLLITFKPENPYSYMFHKINIDLTALQAEALGMKHEMFATNGEKELELVDLKNALLKNEVKVLITGALASDYQRSRIESMCKDLGIEHIAPLWHMNPEEELREISEDYNAIVTQVSAEGLDDSFLGRRIDDAMIQRLKEINRRYRINVAFEGGEAESFVLDGPLFSKRIEIVRSHTAWDGRTGQYVIDDAALKDKHND